MSCSRNCFQGGSLALLQRVSPQNVNWKRNRDEGADRGNEEP